MNPLPHRNAASRPQFRVLWRVALLLALAGCGPHPAERPASALPQAATVTLQTVELKTRLVTEEVVGTLRAKTRAVIEAKISGRIETMNATAGLRVQAGQTLAQLDVREIQARLDQALAQRDQAARDLQRLANLRQQQAVTEQEYDAVEARHRVAKAAAAEAETLRDYAHITAPFAGVVTRKLADVGDLAAPGRPLVELEDPSLLRIEADVPEAFLSRITPGAQMTVHVSAAHTNLTGTVSEIAPAADPATRTFLVKWDLPPDAALRAGQFARVAVPITESSTLRVPASAVVLRGQLELVFVAVDGRAQLRLIKTGKLIEGEVEILAGLSAGEAVVVEDASELVDGQPVRQR